MTATTSDLAASLARFIRRELFPSQETVALHEPAFGGREREYVLDAIDSGFVSSVGKYVDRLEAMVAEYTGAARAVATVNGTAALHAALHLLGVGRDELVITQPLTFVATANAIRYCGADPVFVDVDDDTLGLSPTMVGRFLDRSCRRRADGGVEHRETGRLISACVPMHTFGFPMRIQELAETCRDWKIPVVEDAAESLGSWVANTHTGLFGTMGVFSFNGNKTITTGGGGMIVTRDPDLGARAKHVTTTAKVAHRWDFVHNEIGFNYRMPNLNAALGCAQMEKLEAKLRVKRRLAEAYRALFQKREWKDAGYVLAIERPGTHANYWLNAVRCPDREHRDDVLETTNSDRVMTRPIWRLMYRLPAFENAFKQPCPVAEQLADTVVNLPSSAI